MGALPDEQLTQVICDSAFLLGERLVTAWQRKIRYKRVDRQMEAFRGRMQQLVTYRKNHWPYEYRYWQTQRGAGE